MQIFDSNVNTFLKELEKQSHQYWNIPRVVAGLLYVLVRNGRMKRILEIGTSNGYSGIWLSKGLLDQDDGLEKVLITVESHRERFGEAERNFEKAGVNKEIKMIFGHAPEVFEQEKEIKKGEFDLIFLDATKKQTLELIERSRSLLKEGGLLVIDNILSHYAEMEQVVRFLEGNSSWRGEVISIGSGVWMGAKEKLI